MGMQLKALSQALVKGGLGIVMVVILPSCNKSFFEGMTPKKAGASSKNQNDAASKGSQNSGFDGNKSKDSPDAPAEKSAITKKSLKFGGFLTGQDFSIPQNIVATPPEELASQISASGPFFPSSCMAKAGQECAQSVMEQSLEDALVDVEGGVATVMFDIDASACDANYGPARMEWKPGKGLLKVGCMTDLSGFAGRTWGAVKSSLITECENSGEGSVLYNAQVVGVLDLRATGSPIPTQELTVNVAHMSPEGQGCSLKREGQMISYGPCRSIIQVQRENPGVSAYTEVVFDQLKAPQGVNMFTSGNGTFTVNGWSGSITYGTNGRNATWQATESTKNLKAQGTLEPGY